MKLQNVRNVKMENSSGGRVFNVSFDCEYTDEFLGETSKVHIEIPKSFLEVCYIDKSCVNFRVNPLSIDDNYAKITKMP